MTARFGISGTALAGVVVAERKPLSDDRGFLERLYCENELAQFLNGAHIVQINRTLTVKAGTVRGMHFQYPPHAEMKFVSCMSGSAYDVALDLRQDSPTFLQWHGEPLREGDHKMIVIPAGVAHGLQTLDDRTEMLYFHTAAFDAGAESGLNATDPRLAITWPAEITERSARDMGLPVLHDAFTGVQL